MSKKIVTILIIILAILMAWFVVRFVIGGSEDDWRCVDGQWVKHGVPSAPMPSSGCGADKVISNFDECAAAGFAVMESYPRQCQDDQGSLFIEDIGNELDKTDLIRIDNPRPNQKITSPLMISGQARGAWFFEGSFPVRLYDENGNELVMGVASTDGIWMTDNFISFKAELNFSAPNTSKGMLILEKDNPSGLLENADELRVPVRF